MTTPIPHWIGGAAVASRATARRDRTNPSQPDDLVTVIPIGGEADVHAAVDAASAALPAWRGLAGPARADALHRWGDAIAARADELTAAIVLEVGKPIGEARGEVMRGVAICRFYAGEAVRESGEVIPSQFGDVLQFTVHDPLGVVALVTPWNFPVAIPLWKAAPALAFGNTVVLKPSELSSGVARLLAETSAGLLPPGVFNVVHGDGTTGAALVAHPAVRGVSFTGSAAVGASVRAVASARGIPVQAEMGGKNAVVVLADADVRRAARLTAAGAFRFAGQKCTATSRAIVVDTVRDAFVAALAEEMHALPLGPVTDPASAVGPLVTDAARARTIGALAANPAEHLAGGMLPDDPRWRVGHWMAPTVVAVDTADHPLAQQELFAPVLALLGARDTDHAIALANGTPFGLSASVFTRDLASAIAWTRRIEVGLVRVNGDTTGVDPHAPFGGMKASGSGGREQGRAARAFYTESRTIQIHP
jgi:acyl-CoA reductase-like NAD-dependent aldehyde dehydrogenase